MTTSHVYSSTPCFLKEHIQHFLIIGIGKSIKRSIVLCLCISMFAVLCVSLGVLYKPWKQLLLDA